MRLKEGGIDKLDLAIFSLCGDIEYYLLNKTRLNQNHFI